MTTTSRKGASGGTGAPRGPGGRRGAQDRRSTRDRLLDAAVRLLQEEGESALSTTRLTQEVGIVQSGFYSHFPSVDDCLAEAAAIVVDEVRVPVRQWMDDIGLQESPAPARAVEDLAEHYVRILGLLQERWSWLQLFERYRHASSPLGEGLSALHADAVGDVRDYLVNLWTTWRLPTEAHGPRLELLATLIVDMTLTAARLVSVDPAQDRAAAATTLASAIHPMVVANMEAVRRLEGLPAPEGRPDGA